MRFGAQASLAFTNITFGNTSQTLEKHRLKRKRRYLDSDVLARCEAKLLHRDQRLPIEVQAARYLAGFEPQDFELRQ